MIPFAYDWRRPVEEAAQRLATAVEAALDARVASRQPVRLLAHSTGGLVGRAMQLESPKVWDRMMWHPAARLLLLGTPNDGLWTPMQVLSGDDSLGGVVGGGLAETVSVRERLAAFPGFLQLQADLYGLAQPATWKALADQDLERLRQASPWHHEVLQLAAYEWGLPSQGVLNRAVALRRRLDAQRDKGLERFRSKLAVVGLAAPATPDAAMRSAAGGWSISTLPGMATAGSPAGAPCSPVCAPGRSPTASTASSPAGVRRSWPIGSCWRPEPPPS